jgi:FkbM family methyltransferase
MLISLDFLWPKYRIKSIGIVHVGAHWGEEFQDYARHGLRKQHWVEADPDAFEILKKRIGSQPGVNLYNACISDEEKEVTFNVANNDGQSSSFLELGTHKKIHPSVKYIKKHVLKTVRMDKLFHPQQLDEVNFLAIDVQGAELQVLKSMGVLLNGINYIYLEVNKKETYKGCALVQDIDNYLFDDFKRVETAEWVGDSWSDAFYVRKNLNKPKPQAQAQAQLEE